MCNAVIPPARVKALPGTWLCIECSQEVGGDFIYTAKQENLGKAGSLKLNYGGVSITKKRRPAGALRAQGSSRRRIAHRAYRFSSPRAASAFRTAASCGPSEASGTSSKPSLR